MENASDYLVFCFVLSSVVNAALRFYNSTTVISGKKDQSPVKKQVTKTLNVTTDPEEKRRIIGDTFIKVSLFWHVLICCDAQLIWEWGLLDGGGGMFQKRLGFKKIIEIRNIYKLSWTLLQYTEFLARKTQTIQITGFQ